MRCLNQDSEGANKIPAEGRDLRTYLHGDDFATVGTMSNVQWLKGVLEKRFEIKTECVGPAAAGLGGRGGGVPSGPSPKTTNGEAMREGSEARLLNQVVRCTLEGWEVEPDQRHADLIVQDLLLTGANGVTSPESMILETRRRSFRSSYVPATLRRIERSPHVPITWPRTDRTLCMP